MTQPFIPAAQHFSEGYSGARGEPSVSPSLTAQSEKWNTLAQQTLGKPTSVLSQFGLSPVASNASAPDMEGRYNQFTGTLLPNTQTGASQQTAETALKLKFQGQDEA